MLNITIPQRNENQIHNEISFYIHQNGYQTQSTNIGEDVEKRETLYMWQECKLVWPPWKNAWNFLKNPKTELPYDLAIPLLVIYPKEMKMLIQKDTHTSTFIAILFTIARTWKHKSTSTDDWIKRMWYPSSRILTIKRPRECYA